MARAEIQENGASKRILGKNAGSGKSDQMVRQDPQPRMQSSLDQLGIPLKVVWTSKPGAAKRGEILSGCLFVYDDNEADAWETFAHELVEYKLKEVTQVYRTLVNQLIEGYEKLAYQQKELFIEALPKIMETTQAERPREPLSASRK